MSTLTLGTIDTLTALQAQIGAGNEKQGFHEQGQILRDAVFDGNAAADISPRAAAEAEQAKANLRHYIMAKLGLIVTEVAEGIEEVRKGRIASETYYVVKTEEGMQEFTPAQVRIGFVKPEGLPSELADVVIRAFDLAYELDIDLAASIDEKLTFNATRARLPGKKL